MIYTFDTAAADRAFGTAWMLLMLGAAGVYYLLSWALRVRVRVERTSKRRTSRW